MSEKNKKEKLKKITKKKVSKKNNNDIHSFKERLVAPILLFFTLVISYVIINLY